MSCLRESQQTKMMYSFKIQIWAANCVALYQWLKMYPGVFNTTYQHWKPHTVFSGTFPTIGIDRLSDVKAAIPVFLNGI